MIVKNAREIPLFESLGIFTEAPKKKRKPRVINVRPIRKDYTTSIEPDEAFDVDDFPDDIGDDLSEYDSLDVDIGDDLSDDELLNDPPIEGDDEPDDIDVDDFPDDLGEETFDGDDDLDDIGADDIPDFDSMTDDEISSTMNNEEPEADGDDISTSSEPSQSATSSPTESETTETVPTQGDENVSDTTTSEGEPEQPSDTPPTEEPPAEEGDGGGEVIDATGGEDPEAAGDIGAEFDDIPADGTDPNAQTPTDTTGTDTVESITKDDVRKYELFKRFMNLYNSLQYFIDKLQTGITDNIKFEYATNKALVKFRSLEELTKDYMLLKFQSDSFLQNSFFYEKIKASSLLLLELLNVNKNKKDE